MDVRLLCLIKMNGRRIGTDRLSMATSHADHLLMPGSEGMTLNNSD